ncbi:unnamed protein product [Cylicocyclus nassatus]|uniref:BTB domain-containing protein n=1 Tax=Cylicocyclus nassatus TaxID=53992 RepID=A0AA36GFZ4_CYLNA|nr:unnamed protein product [Cylicocyclus nassatus]
MHEESLVLTQSDAGYIDAKKKFCGFEWEAEATADVDYVTITLWCNRGVEASLWTCTANVSIHNFLGINGDNTMIEQFIHKFHSKDRSKSITFSRCELENDIILTLRNLRDITGYRDALMFELDFTKPSESNNVCIVFEDEDKRVYVNREYLSINSRKFATMFPPNREELSASESDGDDFDVLSMQADAVDESSGVREDLDVNPLSSGDIVPRPTSAANVHRKNGVYLLRDVISDDFITLLRAIYPPFCEVTGANLGCLLSLASQFGVEHIIWKCELYLRTDDGRQCFDLYRRLFMAVKYRMASVESDCMAALQSADDVRSLLEDPRMESAPRRMRPLLLETLLQRLKTEASPAAPKVSATTKDAQTYVCNLFKSIGTSENSTNGESLQNKQCSSNMADEVASVRNVSLNPEGMRQNLEMSFKCTEDIIRCMQRRSENDANANSQFPSLQASSDATMETSTAEERPPPVPPRKKRCEQANRDFLRNLVFETINACKLSKEQSIVLGYTRKAFSAHDIFADLVLPPFSSMKTVTYSFVTHFFTKVYGEGVVQIVKAHLSTELNAFPSTLAERVATAIIAGYELDVQLGNDDLLIHELKIHLQKQLRSEFVIFCENIKAGYLNDSFAQS